MRNKRTSIWSMLVLGAVVGTHAEGHAFDVVGSVRSLFGWGIGIDSDGDQTIIKNGDEMFVGTESREIESTLRVYGAQKPPSIPFGPKGPFGVITHLLVTNPMGHNERLFRELGCEASAAQNATIIQVLANESELKRKVDRLDPGSRRTCANLIGTVFTLRQYYRDGEVQPMDWQVQSGHEVDPNKILILSDVQEISCE